MEIFEIRPGEWAYRVDNIFQEWNPETPGFQPMTYDDANRFAQLTLERISKDPDAPAPAIRSVTRAQAKSALLLTGKLQYIQMAIDSIEDPIKRGLAQIDWDDRLVFEENNPTLRALAAGLGLSENELKQLFDLAETL